MHARRALCKCPDRSETVFIRFLMIDTTSDQDLRSITQKLRPTERFLIRLLAEGSKLVDELSAANKLLK